METKPGIYTTEFWITVLTAIGMVVASVADWLPDKYAAIAIAVSTAAYAIARGLAKSGVAADPALHANYRIAPKTSDGLRR